MLHPDHPLLEKFQRALKEHLQMQIELLSAQVFELASHHNSPLAIKSLETTIFIGNRRQKERGRSRRTRHRNL